MFERGEDLYFRLSFYHGRELVDGHGDGREGIVVHGDNEVEVEKVIDSVRHGFHIRREVPADAQQSYGRVIELVDEFHIAKDGSVARKIDRLSAERKDETGRFSRVDTVEATGMVGFDKGDGKIRGQFYRPAEVHSDGGVAAF